MNDLSLFERGGWKIRTAMIDDKIHFSASDICAGLGYVNPRDAAGRHCRWVVKHDVPHPQSPDKTISLNFIPEGDVLRLITHSDLPEAPEYESWIFDEVIPTINKHGMYATPATVEAMLADPDTMIRTLQALKEERAARVAVEEQLQIAAPKVEFYDTVTASADTLGMDEVAKIIGLPGWGRNNIFALLRHINMLRENNQPYQGYIDRGYFELIEQTPWTDSKGNPHIPTKTVVTQKGLEHIARLVKEADAQRKRTLN